MLDSIIAKLHLACGYQKDSCVSVGNLVAAKVCPHDQTVWIAGCWWHLAKNSLIIIYLNRSVLRFITTSGLNRVTEVAQLLFIMYKN